MAAQFRGPEAPSAHIATTERAGTRYRERAGPTPPCSYPARPASALPGSGPSDRAGHVIFCHTEGAHLFPQRRNSLSGNAHDNWPEQHRPALNRDIEIICRRDLLHDRFRQRDLILRRLLREHALPSCCGKQGYKASLLPVKSLSTPYPNKPRRTHSPTVTRLTVTPASRVETLFSAPPRVDLRNAATGQCGELAYDLTSAHRPTAAILRRKAQRPTVVRAPWS